MWSDRAVKLHNPLISSRLSIYPYETVANSYKCWTSLNSILHHIKRNNGITMPTGANRHGDD